uniref:Uncharacterized protein n=1 Tax=viral metagenome TaxID=1070528 RepID=A0A6C0JN69_9ZZZZ
MSEIIKFYTYIIGIILILAFVITILVKNDKFHDRMFDDKKKNIRTDTQEGIETIVLLTFIGYILFNFIVMSSSFDEIRMIIPNYAANSGIEADIMIGVIEMLVFTTIILGMNVNLHDKMFEDKPKPRVRIETPEGKGTLAMILLIAYVVFYFMLKYAYPSGADFIKPINSLLEVVPLVLSIVLWLLNKIFNPGKPGTTSSSLFGDLDQSLISIYGIFYTLLLVIIFILYSASKDPKALTTNTYVYILMFMLPTVFALLYLGPIMMASSSVIFKTGMISLLALIVIAAIYFYINMNSSSFLAVSFIWGIIIGLILLVGLALLFYMLSNYLKTFTGWSGFIVYFIFYIPCLLIDFFKYILKEFQMTSRLVYVLFFIEILLISLYILLPKIINWFDKKDGVVILDNGVFLNKSTDIGTSELFEIPYKKLESKDIGKVYKTNYSISMWIYLNIQPTNFNGYLKETNIFDFGKGKPKVTYYNDTKDNIHKNKYFIYFTNNKDTNKYEISLPIQKWNNFVFNYESNKVDLFINGELVKSFKFNKSNLPTIEPSDIITVGNKDGLDGAICNVRIYPEKLSQLHITSAYNLLMFKNPPTQSSNPNTFN